MQNKPDDRRADLRALHKSFDVYYRDQARTDRMDRLNAQFLSPGDLAFDIGAHVGDRTASFLRLGARVVTLEPQPLVFRALRLLFGRSPQAVLHCAAAGAERGTQEMFVNSANPTVSTLSKALVDAAPSAETWRGQDWDQRMGVLVTTLDRLIADHGCPDFAKIDVEGHELEVLEGLTRPLKALSFEFTTLQRGVALECLKRLSALGSYEYNVSFGEDHKLQFQEWVDRDAMHAFVAGVPMAANSGDVFARRNDTPSGP